MIKQIKKCYYRLNLPYTATEEQIITNEKILIKVLRAKAIQKGISNKAKIEQVKADTKVVLQCVKENKNIELKDINFDTSFKGIIIQICVLAMIICISATCFFSLL